MYSTRLCEIYTTRLAEVGLTKLCTSSPFSVFELGSHASTHLLGFTATLVDSRICLVDQLLEWLCVCDVFGCDWCFHFPTGAKLQPRFVGYCPCLFGLKFSLPPGGVV